MNELNKLSLTIEVMNCYERKHHKVGIFLQYKADVEQVWQATKRLVEESTRYSNMLSRVNNSPYSTVFWFKNGSVIQIMRASENARGYAFHKVLYDPRIQTNILYDAIYHTEKLREETY